MALWRSRAWQLCGKSGLAGIFNDGGYGRIYARAACSYFGCHGVIHTRDFSPDRRAY